MKTLHGEEHLLYPENVDTNKFDLEISRDIPKALVNLYEKRTKEYIETYGEYAWEKMFKRPNWREEELENTYSDDEEYEDEDEDYEYE
jgi:hypothetical protein